MVELSDVLNNIKQGNANRISIDRQEVVNVTFENDKGKGIIVSIYTGSKYAQFHDEFVQTATTIQELQPLIQYLDTEGYRTNLD